MVTSKTVSISIGGTIIPQTDVAMREGGLKRKHNKHSSNFNATLAYLRRSIEAQIKTQNKTYIHSVGYH
jgi:hypothetical protein